MSVTPFKPEDVFSHLTMNERLEEIDDEIIQVNKQVNKIGDIKITARTDLGDNWLLCNGDSLDKTEYPELSQLLLDRLSVNTNADADDAYVSSAQFDGSVTGVNPTSGAYPVICKGVYNGVPVVACVAMLNGTSYGSSSTSAYAVAYTVINAETGASILSGTYANSYSLNIPDYTTSCYICSGNLYVRNKSAGVYNTFLKIPLNGDEITEVTVTLPSSVESTLKAVAAYNDKLYFIAWKNTNDYAAGLYRADPDFTNQELLQTFSTPAAWDYSGYAPIIQNCMQFDILETGEALISVVFRNNAGTSRYCYQSYYIKNIETETALVEKVGLMDSTTNYAGNGMVFDGTMIFTNYDGSIFYYHPSMPAKQVAGSVDQPANAYTLGLTHIQSINQVVACSGGHSSSYSKFFAIPFLYRIEDETISFAATTSAVLSEQDYTYGCMSKYVDIGGNVICCMSDRYSGGVRLRVYKSFGVGLPALPEITSDASFNYIKAKEDS